MELEYALCRMIAYQHCAGPMLKVRHSLCWAQQKITLNEVQVKSRSTYGTTEMPVLVEV